MDMKMKIVLFAIAAAAVCAADAEFATDLSSGWRLTVSPQFNFNMKGRMGVKQSAIRVPASSYSSTRAAAAAAHAGLKPGAGRTEYPNGAYIDASDAAGIDGETWNWHVPAGELDNGSMTFSSAYYERSTVYSATGGSAKDDTVTVGANFGVDRAVWYYGGFGVDIGFNFGFFVKNNWFRGESGGYVRTDTYKEGRYDTEVNLGNAEVLNDPWAQNPDGSFGAGTFDGPGPVLRLDDITVMRRHSGEGSGSSTSSYGPFSIRGDLHMYEFQLALKPYWEVTDWFVVRGTLGVGLDYRDFDVRVSETGKGSERDWDCYMICGLGGMFRWKDVCIGADFLRKVFDDDMDVDTKYVHGTIRNASWMLRVYLGYEF
jgi:hypothetical protein